MDEKTDRYENDRFDGRCPTCGQIFYKEVFDALEDFLTLKLELDGATRDWPVFQEQLKRIRSAISVITR